MKLKQTLFPLLVVSCALGIDSAFAAAEAPTPKPKAPQPSPNSAEVLGKAPRSVFSLPSGPKDGKNPFFPRSTEFHPRPVEVAPVRPADFSSFLVLNGITGPPRPTVMINGHTLAKGETGEIKIGQGAKLIVKCEEIGVDSAVILVNNTTRKELKLRQGV
jgi:hypothetical protein